MNRIPFFMGMSFPLINYENETVEDILNIPCDKNPSSMLFLYENGMVKNLIGEELLHVKKVLSHSSLIPHYMSLEEFFKYFRNGKFSFGRIPSGKIPEEIPSGEFSLEASLPESPQREIRVEFLPVCKESS